MPPKVASAAAAPAAARRSQLPLLPCLLLLLLSACGGALGAAEAAPAAPAGRVETAFLRGAPVDLAAGTVTLPLHHARLPDGTGVGFIVTEASTPAAAKAWGASHSPALAAAAGTGAAQKARALPAAAAAGPSAAGGAPLYELNSTVDFDFNKRTVVPGRGGAAFPPAAFNYSAKGQPGYTPLMQLPDGTVLNAPHVFVTAPPAGARPPGAAPGPRPGRHPKVLAVAPNGSSVAFSLTRGFSKGEPIIYISTDASDPLAAALENVVFAPRLASVPPAALIDLIAFTNGATGAANPQRQGLSSAIADGLPPLNIVEATPESPDVYSPLWAITLAKWKGATPGPRQTSIDAVQALAAAGRVAGFDPKAPASDPPLAPSGIVVNCPIVAILEGGKEQGVPVTRAGGPGGAGGCQHSALGYDCMTEPQPGLLVHYSLAASPSAPPPGGCFSAPGAAAPPAVTAPAGANGGASPQVAHFAFEAQGPGWIALSFPQTAGKMYPADAVIGGLAGGPAGAPPVRTFHLKSHEVAPGDETTGWAQAKGWSAANGGKVLCFSRALDAPTAAVVKDINPAAALPMNWALGPGAQLAHHIRRGALEVALNGSAAASDSGGGDDGAAEDARYQIAHGALMMTAFILLFPAASLFSRHKWAFGDRDSGNIRGHWFQAHRAMNVLALAAAVTAIALIFSRFGWSGPDDTSQNYGAHRGVGLTAFIMAVVQAALGLVRPHLGTPKRPIWRRLHQAWGWLTVAMGTAAAYLGINLAFTEADFPLAPWLGPALAITATLLLCGLVLEARKLRLQAAGAYDKHAHTVSAKFADGPAAPPPAGVVANVGPPDGLPK